MDDPLIGRTVGGVSLEAKLGAGGMASVYAGRDLEDGGARRAIKLLAVTSHADTQARFQREGRIGHGLRHALVVRVHRFGVSGDYHYLVMDLVEGEDLAHVLQRTGALQWPLVAAIGRDVAFALAAVHERDVVHRDLKPQNVLLDGQGRIKLADFGLARWRGGPSDLPDPGASLTHTGDAFGTPIYMAPEQFSDAKAVGPAADLYALGVVLFECLTGRTPFNASSPHELARLHKATDPPSLEALAADAPLELRRQILRLLAKRSEERPRSAGEAARALGDLAARGETQPLPLRGPPGTKDAAWDPAAPAAEASTRPPRRRAASLGAPVALALVAAGLVGAWQMAWARLLLASPEERARYEAVRAARTGVRDDPAGLVAAIEQYQRDADEEWLLAEDVAELRRTPVLARGENVYVVPEMGAGHPMVHVPGGEYTIGREGAEGEAFSERRTVRLQGFLIDRREVSNRLYREFLARWRAAGARHACGDPDADHRTALAGDDRVSPDPDGPVVGLDPRDAREYARFYDRRLPSEAEWEVAASWDAKSGEPRPYPWGRSEPDDAEGRYFANLAFAEWGEVDRDGDFVRRCAPTGSFEFDESPFGLLDAAGNAAEWCAGRLPLPGAQPIRGGSIGTDDAEDALLAHRREHDPSEAPPADVGFRTVRPFEARPE